MVRLQAARGRREEEGLPHREQEGGGAGRTSVEQPHWVIRGVHREGGTSGPPAFPPRVCFSYFRDSLQSPRPAWCGLSPSPTAVAHLLPAQLLSGSGNVCPHLSLE